MGPSSPSARHFTSLLSRRELFGRVGTGIGGLALATLLGRFEPVAAAAPGGPRFDLAPRPPHFPARARAVIQLFMHGGPSQMDLFDPKPMLQKYDGRKPSGRLEVPSAAAAGGYLASPFKFRKHGQAGIVLGETLPEIAKHADEIAVVRSMHTGHNNHEQALWMMHTGALMSGRPSIGSWVTYALGAETQNLPAYVALTDPGGLPIDGFRNWSSGWMPPIYQGTALRSQGPAMLNLEPHRRQSAAVRRGQLELLGRINRQHLESHPGELELEARIASYELAARMQLSATDALNLAAEPAATRALYGLDHPTTASYGTRCLMARRLVERGVRYVQIYMAGQPWDTHTNNQGGIRRCSAQTDLPVAGLMTDLKRRGLLDTTLVIWGGEFGRLPIAQSRDGRDHNRNAFSLWLAGGGIKGGQMYGGTDDFGYRAVENPVSVHDLHATIFHLLGLDITRLTFNHNGRDERLNDVHKATVVRALLG